MPNPFRKNVNVQKQKKHIGEVRQSQLLSSFGIGSIVDFVNGTAMIGGIDDWDKDNDWENRKIYNENLRSITGAEYFLAPKTSDGNKYSASSQDVIAYSFPRKLYCPACKSIIDIKEVENQPNKYKCNQYTKDHKPCKGRLVHSRFILVCENGHVDDFPYSWWVHNGKECPTGKKSPRIKMYNVGGRSDTESLWLECSECGQKRSMARVFGNNIFSGEDGRSCSGIHPHLNFYKEECDAVPRTRLRSSSGVFFPIIYSAILIPPWTQKVFSIIQKNYDQLSYMSYEKRAEYIKDKIAPKYPNIDLQDFLAAYDKVESGNNETVERTSADVFSDEYKVLCKDSVSDERFSSHSVEIPEDFTNVFEIITAVDKLVITQAMVGFTRIKADEEHIVPLSRNNAKKKKWLPAVELNGEGIFIKFSKTAVDAWVDKNSGRYGKMNISYKNSGFKNPRYSPQYVMLHTFAHLLIRQISNECGYSTASLSEKIYSTFTEEGNNEEMMGVLIYLSTPDSDGSLGGLVNVVDNTELMDNVLKNMLREAKWCSGDPICSLSEHQGYNSLNYAACHACTLLPETSCESRNLFLDRISIIGNSDEPELGIMGCLANKI